MKRFNSLTILSLITVLLLGSCISSKDTLIEIGPTAALKFTDTQVPASPTTAPPPTIKPSNTILPTNHPLNTPVTTGSWEVPVVEVRQWSEGDYIARGWIDNASIAFEGKDSNTFILDRTGNLLSWATPTPYPTIGFPQRMSAPSGKGEFEIYCGESGVKMVRLPGRELISQSNLPVGDCISVSWAHDGAAASVVTDQRDVYVWRTDGSEPYWVGQAASGSTAKWSSDDHKLLVFDYVPEAGEATFNIVYPDGKSMSITGARIEAGNEWAPENLTWLTEDIARNMIGCVIPNYCLHDYYHVATGKFLIRNSIGESGGQNALLSPDQRWLAMEVSPHADVWDERYSFDITEKTLLVLYDLGQQQKLVWAESEPVLPALPGVSFEFIGWSNDSNQFYFVYYPLGRLSTDLPAGYTRLDRNTLKTELLVPNVVYSKLSPDGQFIFIVTAEQIEEQTAYGLSAGIFTLDGRSVEQVSLADQLEFEVLAPTDFYNQEDFDPYPDLIPAEWNDRAIEIVFSDPEGDLWLMSTIGEKEKIASSLPSENLQENPGFFWSPNGVHLLILWGEHAWVAQIHKP
jgi:hypothetical protein